MPVMALLVPSVSSLCESAEAGIMLSSVEVRSTVYEVVQAALTSNVSSATASPGTICEGDPARHEMQPSLSTSVSVLTVTVTGVFCSGMVKLYSPVASL